MSIQKSINTNILAIEEGLIYNVSYRKDSISNKFILQLNLIEEQKTENVKDTHYQAIPCDLDENIEQCLIKFGFIIAKK